MNSILINFHFTQFVNKAQTLHSACSSLHIMFGFPIHGEVLAADPPQPHLYLCHLQITLYTSFRGGWKCQWLGTFLRNGFQPQVGTEFPQHINVCYMRRRHCKEPGISSCPKGWLSPGGNLHPGYRSSGICLPCGILQIPSLGTTLCECHTEPRLWIEQSF